MAAVWFLYDQGTGDGERPVAGPFLTAEEAAGALKDVAYPFVFPWGPRTVCGDLFAGTARRTVAETVCTALRAQAQYRIALDRLHDARSDT